MNIYQKLTKARNELQELKLKKSGSNQSISYYELGDFLPAINSLCLKHDLMTNFSIIRDKSVEKAVLTVLDASKPQEKTSFISPTEDVSLPRGQAIQGLGAKITYMRRYMLMIAFEIVESDMVDSINRDLTEDVSSEDGILIKNCKTVKQLEALYKELSKKYKMTLIQPLFAEVKEKINQEESKA